MDEWMKENWLGLAALLVAGIGIPIAIWATRRWGNRRAKLQVVTDSTGLLVAGELKEKLVVTYEGTPVDDPHLVTLLLRNIGSRDITRQHFDEGIPLMFALNSEFYGLVDTGSNNKSYPSILTAATETENDVLGFNPAHIPTGTEWVVKFIVSGPVTIERSGNLIDTDFVDGETTSRSFFRLVGSTMFWSFPDPRAYFEGLREIAAKRR